RSEAPAGTLEAISRVHPPDYIRGIERAMPTEGYAALDSDTIASPGTWKAALHAAGGATLAVDIVMRGEADNVFVAVRPPGHHAELARPMGFCLFNNAAIAARHAQAAHGAERVAIMDFDVHHGNGTQAVFWSDPSVLYCSTHEMPLYPGTGAQGEAGAYGTIVNAPLSAGADGDLFKEAVETKILPAIAAFAPDLLVISAGFDAHYRDPLANLNLTEADFAWITGKLMDLALNHCDGRIVSVLEGGYDLEALAASSAAHLLTLMGSSVPEFALSQPSPSTGS
ncbi:MAG TPA: histone deacetylase family protein, partial [Methylovirgula sp.]|nr:histone deacetylase family protein [Methylovirgula sp.]